MTEPDVNARLLDPRAIRVTPTGASGQAGGPLVVEPPAIPVGPLPHATGRGILGGLANPPDPIDPADEDGPGVILVDGSPVTARLERLDGLHGLLVETDPDGTERRTPVLFLPPHATTGPRDSVTRREVVVDGWSVELELEPAGRAALRERARRGHDATARGGPTEVRAIIPGRVASVSVVPGDAVEAGQQLLVVEAMKMQNELRSPRDGTIEQVAVGAGDTIEVGDLLLVLA
jgi:biotin carboxyl carrier protein